MNNRDIIKELGRLKEVRPAKGFLDRNRNELLTFLEKDVVKKNTIFAIAKDKKTWYDIREKLLYKLLKPAGVLLLALSVITGGGVGMSFASQNTIPGDIFYPVKLTIEKAQVSLKTKEEDKVKLEVEFAGRRLDELNKVKANEIIGNKKDPEKTKIVLDNFKKNIETVKNRLDKIKENEFTKESGDVVDMVEKKTLEYSKALENMGEKTVSSIEYKVLSDVKSEGGMEGKVGQDAAEGEQKLEIGKEGTDGALTQAGEAVEEGGNKEGQVVTETAGDKEGQVAVETDEENEFKKVINEALAVSEETNNKAFGIIIEKQQTGEIDMSKEEVAQKVKNKIDDVKNKVENLKDQAGVVKTQENDSGMDKKDSMIGEMEESQKSIKSKLEGGEEIVAKDGNSVKGSIATSTSSGISGTVLNLGVSTSTPTTAINNTGNVLPATQINNMGDKLTEADNLLKNGEIVNAFEKVKEIKEITKDVEKKIEAAKVSISQDIGKIIKIDTGVIATSTVKTATTTKKY